MAETKEIPQVKIGDMLAFAYGYHGNEYILHEITKITPSGRMICGPYTLNPDLSVRGGGYRAAQIVTPEIKEALLRQKCLNIIASAKWKEMGNEFLFRIATAIKGEVNDGTSS